MEVMKKSRNFSKDYINEFFGSKVFEEYFELEEEVKESVPLINTVGRVVSVTSSTEPIQR